MASWPSVAGTTAQGVVLEDGAGAAVDMTVPSSTEEALKNPTDLSQVVFNQATAADHTVVAAVAAQTTRVHRLIMSVAGAVVVTVKRGTTTLAVLRFAAATNVPFVLPFASRPYFVTGTNEALVFTLSGAVQVDATVGYVTSA